MKVTATLLTIAFFSLSLHSQAQTKKGEKILGASIAFKNGESEVASMQTVKTTAFNFSPSLGFGLGNNWIAGFALGYDHTREKDKRADLNNRVVDAKVNVFSVGGWARKFYPFNNQFGMYGQANASVGFGKAKREDDQYHFTTEADVNAFSVDLQPGFYFLPGKKIVLEATFGSIGYTSTKTDYEDETPFYDTKTSNFNFSVVDGLSLGVKFIF